MSWFRMGHYSEQLTEKANIKALEAFPHRKYLQGYSMDDK